jgi:glycine cleavage system H protein
MVEAVMIESATREREALPCIWVLAGVLSYRLCDRNYECENCELYHALHGSGHSSMDAATLGSTANTGLSVPGDIESRVSSCICQLSAGCELHLDRPYCPCHFWLRRTHGDQVLIGIDSHLLKLLYPIDDVTLPHVGVLLKRGDTCGWITRGRMAIPLKAPLNGEVEAVNERYLAKISSSGVVDGSDEWVLSLTAHEDLDSVPGLYRGEAALAWYLKKVQLIKRYLREAAATDVDDVVGMTLHDGGEPNLDIETVLGRERFESLVVEIFNIRM